MTESEKKNGDGTGSPRGDWVEEGESATASDPAVPDPAVPDPVVPDLSVMTVREVCDHVAGARPEPGDALWAALQSDSRKGVRGLCDRMLRRRSAERAVREREERMRRHEAALWNDGATHVAGVDEAGRGPLAGPVVAAAVVLPRELPVQGIDDSKKLTAARREELYELIHEHAVSVGTGAVDHDVIDEINILNATRQAMREAVASLSVTPDHVLVDGDPVPDAGFPQTAINQGDSRSTAIAAASIVAKVTRDRMLVEADLRYPGYGFARHKGYGTKEHISALMRLGPCEIHRRSFRVVLDTAGGMSALYAGFKAAMLRADSVELLDRIAREVAGEKERLVPYELSKLRGLYKRCYVRLKAGIPATK